MKIFIANFPYELTESDICEIFEIFGEITSCKLVRNPETGKSKGFGFVEFKQENHARMAMKKMNGIRISDRIVAVTLSTSESTEAHLRKMARLKKETDNK